MCPALHVPKTKPSREDDSSYPSSLNVNLGFLPPQFIMQHHLSRNQLVQRRRMAGGTVELGEGWRSLGALCSAPAPGLFRQGLQPSIASVT